MYCTNHPQELAVTNCSTYGKAICTVCSNPVYGKTVCPQCLAASDYPHPIPSSSDNTMAILSLVASIIGLFGFFVCGSIGVILGGMGGSILGFIAYRQLKKKDVVGNGPLLAKIGLFLGLGELVFGLLITVVAIAGLLFLFLTGAINSTY